MAELIQDDGGDGNLSLVHFSSSVPHAPKFLVLYDETGQPWAVTVRTDGQLQTELFASGENPVGDGTH